MLAVAAKEIEMGKYTRVFGTIVVVAVILATQLNGCGADQDFVVSEATPTVERLVVVTEAAAVASLTATETATAVATLTATATSSPTHTAVPTETPTASPTMTPVPTVVPTLTAEPTATAVIIEVIPTLAVELMGCPPPVGGD